MKCGCWIIPALAKAPALLRKRKLYEWALLLYKLARARYKPDSILLYGRSMGSGIAAQLGAVRDCRKLILETPYYDFPSILSSRIPLYPMERMIKFKIPTWQYLQQVTAPVTIFHGTSDGVIPYRNASRLKPYLKQKTNSSLSKMAVIMICRSFPLYQQKMDSLLRQ